jgi:hypothetical protein
VASQNTSRYFKLPDAVLGVRMLTKRQKCEHWTSGSVLPDFYKSFEFMNNDQPPICGRRGRRIALLIGD